MDVSLPEGGRRDAGRREWLGLLILALPTLLLSLDLSVLYLALPHLAADLDASGTQQLWILDTYGFMVAGFLVTMGTLGDRIGRRRLLLIGGAFFAVASVIAAFSTSAPMLIGARALLGVAGATLAPSTLALITNMFANPKQRGAAIGIWSACFMGGAVIGPVIGGILLSQFWWGSVFLLAVPVMILLLAAGPVLLPEFRNPDAGRVDLLSVAMSLAAIIPFIYGLKKLAADGWELPAALALVFGVVMAVLFVRRQKHLADPLFDMSLFSIGPLRTALGLSLVVGTVQGGSLLLVNLFLQLVHGYSPLRTGLLLGPPALGMILSIMISVGLARFIRPAYLMAAGLLISAIGYLVLTRVEADGGLTGVLVGAALAMAGVGPVVSLGSNIIVTSAPPQKAGSASAAVETNGQFGVAFGVAVSGSIAAAVYRDHLVVPAGVVGDALNTARESLPGALAVAARLPAALAGPLVASARDSFTSGLHVVAIAAAALFILLSVFTWASLRRIEPMRDGFAPPGGAPVEAAPEAAAENRVPAASVGTKSGPSSLAVGDGVHQLAHNEEEA
ncbi:MFS transporter [Micromonospora mangrovi]|uniref:MFS transporter n=2 Tax=Micromonospora TaxID=1873 RepID=A0AAU8HF90_9ACTN